MKTKVEPTPFKYLFPDKHIELVYKRKKCFEPEWTFYVKATDTHPEIIIDFKKHKMVHKSCLKAIAHNTYELDREAIKQRRKEKRTFQSREDYDDWWQEQNLNGGFAYEGVTDDF